MKAPTAPSPPSVGAAVRRTAGVVAADLAGHLDRRRPVLPRTPAKITPAWLGAALGRPVRSVTITRPSAGTTTRAALRVSFNDPDLPELALFAKCTSSLAQRLMLGHGGLIAGEPGFYNQLRPLLEIESPSGHYADVDSRSWRSIVILEDVVATRGARFWTPAEKIGRSQAEDLLAQAASWHGALWADPRLDALAWLRTPGQQMALIDALLGLANRVPAGFERARSVIPLRLWARRDGLLEAMRSSMAAASGRPLTLLHGDLHAANTYCAHGRSGVSDWQVVMKGSWCFDVAYLIATALEVEDRRAWERDLLDHYLERLQAAGGDAVLRDRAWESYRASMAYPLFAWLYTLGRARLQPRFQPEATSLTLVGRLATAVDDLESLDARA